MHVAIIGNGITGVTTALALRELQPDWRITMISGESTYPYSRPALMYIFMGHMRYAETKTHEDHVWKNERIDLVRDWVTRIDAERKVLTLHAAGELAFDKLLVATGSKSSKFGWPGQDLDGVQGLYDLMDLKRLYETAARTRHAVIVGGGLIGIELAEMLHSRGIHVTFLVREPSYWNNILPAGESGMINRLIRASGMDLKLESELAEIVGDERGQVREIVTKDGEHIACELVGLTPGVSPNVVLAKESGLPVERGILVDDTLATSLDGIYAAGDCAEIVKPEGTRNMIQQVWYTGKLQGRAVARSMAGDPAPYDPGIWYNSAKFLDLEYHTYGMVMPSADESDSLYWEHASHLHCMRLVHDTELRLVAMDSMGLRMKHRVFEPWIRERLPVADVLARLSEAVFDPEFSRRHEPEIRRVMGEQLAAKPRQEQPA